MTEAATFLDSPEGRRLAYCQTSGASPGVVFLPGFKSDMEGTKALALEAHLKAKGRAMLRFDYSGHGRSSGAFEDGTVSAWKADTLAVIDALTEGPQILVGSSMGGWLALLAALARPDRVAGLVLIAPAPDFTEKLMWANFGEAAKKKLLREGWVAMPSDYDDEPYKITRALIEDGRNHQLLDGPIPFDGPVRLLHGQEDPDVPWEWSMKIAERLTSDDVIISLNKAGDHRLSEPDDIARLCRAVDDVASKLGG